MNGDLLFPIVALLVALAVFLIIAIDAALEWRDRRHGGAECTHYSRCEHCGEGS